MEEFGGAFLYSCGGMVSSGLVRAGYKDPIVDPHQAFSTEAASAFAILQGGQIVRRRQGASEGGWHTIPSYTPTACYSGDAVLCEPRRLKGIQAGVPGGSLPSPRSRRSARTIRGERLKAKKPP